MNLGRFEAQELDRLASLRAGSALSLFRFAAAWSIALSGLVHLCTAVLLLLRLTYMILLLSCIARGHTGSEWDRGLKVGRDALGAQAARHSGVSGIDTEACEAASIAAEDRSSADSL
ncbi:hypothetical protein CBOM_05683 [Ceraceosorus bombacis]|uniref:Uncharacterized protein n=1 Tax=Ceraceosorus bombacis TaxID=401625 RepID=A0A0N7LBC4_9BASI|nr:hypothetical protein CBOM_05683 [Ceraceosorus bombacis]